MLEGICSRFKILFWKLNGSNMGQQCRINYHVSCTRLKDKLIFGNNVALDRGVHIVLTKTDSSKKYLINIGNQVYINRNTIIDATTYISIGDNCMIGPGCYITDHDHAFQKLPSNTPINTTPLDGKNTIIENNVWIGANVTILKGVTIGKNTVIGAGSIVTKSIPENAIAVGNPCKVIKNK